MAQIEVGTCGYSYADWVGPVYPPGTKQADYLEYYSKLFSVVEIDYTYYTQPKEEQIKRMLDVAPKLHFAIKANQLLTHTIDHVAWKDHVAEYQAGIFPLITSQNLVAVLLQFPQSFHYTTPNRKYLAELIGSFEKIPITVEFRNKDWYGERTIRSLDEMKIPLVAFDMPKVKDAPPLLNPNRAKVLYLRLHGRNIENWYTGTSETRYDYLYNDSEMDEILTFILGNFHRYDKIFVLYNNHRRGQAVKNANQLIDKLQKRHITVVTPGVKNG